METTTNYKPINTASILKVHSSSKLYETGKRFYSTTDNEAITNPNITPIAYRILSYLLSNNESFSPNQKVIARKLSMSKNTVKLGLQNLIEFGYLNIVQTGHNRYHYNISAISFQGSKIDPTNTKIQGSDIEGSKYDPLKNDQNDRGQNMTHEKQAKIQGSDIEGSDIEGSDIGLLNNNNLNNENLNNDNLNNDNFNSSSIESLDKKSSPEGSIFYSEKFPTEIIPQPENEILSKFEAEESNIDSTGEIINDSKSQDNYDYLFSDPISSIPQPEKDAEASYILDTDGECSDAVDIGDTKDVIILTYGSGMYDICVEMFGVKDIYTQDEVTKAFHISFDRF